MACCSANLSLRGQSKKNCYHHAHQKGVAQRVFVPVKAKLANDVGAGRFLWAKVLARNLSHLENKHKLRWYQEMSFWFVLWKRSNEEGFNKKQPLNQGESDAPPFAQRF